MRILHLSADYPDPLEPAKTRAVANLLSLVSEHEHLVYSLNRVDWRHGIAALDFGDAAGKAHRAVAYAAPPYGVMLGTFLRWLADWILTDLKARGLRPDLVHAHKLSVEGLAGALVAERLGLPLVLSVQGDSDTKIVSMKRSLRARYRALWHGAAVVFPFAPWAKDKLDGLLGLREGPTTLLPCPGSGPEFIAAPVITGPEVVTAFHLAVWRRKNAEGLFRAIGLAAAENPEIRLRVIGGGSPEAFARLSRLADRLAPGRVIFEGAVPHEEVGPRFNAAAAFALVSHRESFGMVFAEALLAGTPCLIPAGAGIDGYFPESPAIVPVPAIEPSAMADGLTALLRNQTRIKETLARMQTEGLLDCFTRSRIAEIYKEGQRCALDRRLVQKGIAA